MSPSLGFVPFDLHASNCPETHSNCPNSRHNRHFPDLPAQLVLRRHAFWGRIMPSLQNC